MSSAISQIFYEFLIFCDICDITAKFEKLIKYMSMLHESTVR